MLAWVLYLALGGSFVFGGAILSEIGRYELWDEKKRFSLGLGIGAIIFLLSTMSLMFENGYWIFPFIFFFLLGAGKLSVRTLNSTMPERFQPTGEELKQKYSDMFRVNASEIEEMLRGELEFIEKLGMSVELPKKDEKERETLPEPDTASELGELRKVIKKFLEKKEKWE
jgi:hypothetical protein